MNANETTDRRRDDRLGAAINELDVPEHTASFHAELRSRLAAERAVASRRARVRWGVRVTALAAAVAAVLAVVGIPRVFDGPQIAGPSEATAATVKAHVRAAFAAMRNLSGDLVATGADGRVQRWQFTIDASGDVRLEGPLRGDVITYEASSGMTRSAQHSASMGGDAIFYAERDGVAPGPPDQGPPTWILPEQFGAYVRAALAAGDAAITAVDYNSRPAWRLNVKTEPNAVAPDFSGDELQITVDRQTGLPVRVRELKQGTMLRELRLDNLSTDSSLPTDTFKLAFPAGAEVTRFDDGFRPVAFSAVQEIVGYAPLRPTSIPSGFHLAEVAVARESATTGKGSQNPPSRMVVSLSYRRGIDQFLVTTRLRGSGQWSDPLAAADGFADNYEKVGVRGGALGGSIAELEVSPHAAPHLWIQNSTLVVTVGGDLSRRELLQVAESLRSDRP